MLECFEPILSGVLKVYFPRSPPKWPNTFVRHYTTLQCMIRCIFHSNTLRVTCLPPVEAKSHKSGYRQMKGLENLLMITESTARFDQAKISPLQREYGHTSRTHTECKFRLRSDSEVVDVHTHMGITEVRHPRLSSSNGSIWLVFRPYFAHGQSEACMDKNQDHQFA